MADSIRLGEIGISVVRRKVKHAHLAVHPPHGRVTLVVPLGTRQEVARAFAITKLGWIRSKRDQLRNQARETPRRYVERESHWLWGKRYLLSIVEKDAKPTVRLDHRRITLSVRPESDGEKRGKVIHAWHKALLHEAVPPLIAKWEAKLGVKVSAYFLQRMKTRWGGCNARAGTIRLNTELVKKPRDLLEYVVLHEIIHLIEPSHDDRFLSLLSKYYPAWREARAELNNLPLSADTWS